MFPDRIRDCHRQASNNTDEICRNISRSSPECLERVNNYFNECRKRIRQGQSRQGRGGFAVINADVEVREKRNNGKKATLTVYPTRVVLTNEKNEVISISPNNTKQIVFSFFPDLLGVLMLTTENGDQKVCKVSSLKSIISNNGKKGLKVEVLTSEYKGEGATAKKALSLLSLHSRENNATLYLVFSQKPNTI